VCEKLRLSCARTVSHKIRQQKRGNETEDGNEGGRRPGGDKPANRNGKEHCVRCLRRRQVPWGPNGITVREDA